MRRFLALLAGALVSLACHSAIAGFIDVGPAPVSEGFGARFVYYDALGDINDVGQAIDILKSGEGTIVDGTLATANTADNGPGGSAGGGYTLSQAKDRFLGAPDGDNNDVVWIYNGILDVPEDGDYTFGIDGDDGQRVTIEGASFTMQAGGGAVLDPTDGFEFFGNTGNAFTTASTFLTAGQHRIEYIGYERGGGAFGELFSAKGIIEAGNSANWLPVGDTSTTVAVPPAPRDVRMVDAASVINGPDANSVSETLVAIKAALLDPAAPRNRQETIRIASGDMPNGGGDEYSTGVFGTLLVDDGDDIPGETLQLTFTLRSDDGSALHIFGQDFIAKGGDDRGALAPIDGSDVALVADFFTGNTNVLGLIELEEGTHGFEAFHFEGGGGDYLDIWIASGDHTAGFNDSFYPLSVSGALGAGTPANAGLGLVPEPSGSLLVVLGLVSFLGLRRRR